jgi:hypothetical protein
MPNREFGRNTRAASEQSVVGATDMKLVDWSEIVDRYGIGRSPKDSKPRRIASSKLP